MARLWWLFIPFFAAVAARGAAQALLGLHSWEYDEIARNVVEGRGYVYDHLGTTYRAFATPLYPLLLAGLGTLFGTSGAVFAAFQALLGGALAMTCAAIGAQLGGAKVGFVAGAAVALHPGLVVYATNIHALNIDALLAAVAVWLLLIAADAPLPRTHMALGLLAGAITLTRPTYLVFVAPCVAVLLLRDGDRGRMVRRGALALALTVTVVAPWVVRDQVLFGRPILSTSIGEGLWRGNNPHASGGAITDDGVAIIDAAPEVRAAVWGRPELEQDDFFTATALAYMRADFGRTLRDTLAKLVAFWWFSARSGALYSPLWLQIYEAYYTVVLALAAVGIAVLVRRGARWAVAIIGGATLTVSFLQAIFYVEGRHRWEVEALLLVLGACGARWLWERATTRRRGSPIPGS